MTDIPLEPSIITIVWAFYVHVAKVEKIGEKYFVHFEGSWESLCFGSDAPFKKGDLVRIEFRKVEDALP